MMDLLHVELNVLRTELMVMLAVICDEAGREPARSEAPQESSEALRIFGSHKDSSEQQKHFLESIVIIFFQGCHKESSELRCNKVCELRTHLG